MTYKPKRRMSSCSQIAIGVILLSGLLLVVAVKMCNEVGFANAARNIAGFLIVVVWTLAGLFFLIRGLNKM